MLDIRFIRENAEAVQQNARNKGYDINVENLLQLDEKKRDLQMRVDELRQRRNENTAAANGSRPTPEQILEGKSIKEELANIEPQLNDINVEFTTLLKKIPNMSAGDVPIGMSEDDNLVSKTIGEPRQFDFQPLNHAEIAAKHGWIDKERAAKVSGSRFAYIEGDLVKLQMAIVQFVFNALSDEQTLSTIAANAGQPFLARHLA